MAKKTRNKQKNNSINQNAQVNRHELHKIGKTNIYIILAMIILGLSVAIYRMM